MSGLRDDLYKAYLEEMQALENFRVTYTGVHRGAAVEREDPDVPEAHRRHGVLHGAHALVRDEEPPRDAAADVEQ